MTWGSQEGKSSHPITKTIRNSHLTTKRESRAAHGDGEVEVQGGMQRETAEEERENEGGRREGTHDLGFEGRLHLPVLQLLPVNPPEEGVSSHVLLALGTTTQSLQRLLSQELKGRSAY